MQQRRAPGQVAYGPPWGRIRAYRAFDLRHEIERRMIVFGLGGPGRELGPDLARHLARALRAERRAARTWGRGYDIMRHLTLVRMQRALDSRRRQKGIGG